MSIALIIFCGITSIVIGKWSFGKWFNPLGLYGFVWCFSLSLLETNLIQYYPLSSETWFLIISGWLSFSIGVLTIVASRSSLQRNTKQGFQQYILTESNIRAEQQVLYKILFIINTISFLNLLHLIYLIKNIIGDVTNVLAVGNFLYSFRVREGIPGSIPYVGSLMLTGCLLAGVYASSKNKIQLITVIPIIISILTSIFNMGRAMLILACILFIAGYFFEHIRTKKYIGVLRNGSLRKYFGITLVIAMIIGGAEVVRSNRGSIESYGSATGALKKIGKMGFITPSIFMYVTANNVVFDQYLKSEKESEVVGNYTLAPFWRTLAKIGFDTYVNQYQPFYYTPVRANTGTYLRELHVDFGILGVLFGPYILGVLSSFFWFRIQKLGRLLDIVFLGFLFVVIAMSIFYWVLQLGYWLSGLLYGICIALYVDRQVHKKNIHIRYG